MASPAVAHESALDLLDDWGQEHVCTPGPRHRDLLAFCGMLLCVAIVAALVGAGLLLARMQLPQVRHTPPVFEGLENRPDRPTGPAAAAVNVLLVGTDRRSDVPTTGTGAAAPMWIFGQQRADTIMVVHIAADRSSAQVVSLPRDSWVDVPGYGSAKLNAAYSWGGLPLTVETVEQLTGVRIDHVALVDWSGFASLVDTLGGVEVTVPQRVVDSARGIVWPAGHDILDGDAALAYVGQRYGLPAGDLDRVRRQQAVVRALVAQIQQSRLQSDLSTLTDLVGDVLRDVSADETWSLEGIVALVWSLRALGPGEVDYLTAPVAGTPYIGDQSVVALDAGLGAELWRAVREDRADRWLLDHSQLETPETVR